MSRKASRSRGLFLFLALGAVGLVGAGDAAPRYKFVTIDVPGSTNTAMYGITNKGLVTGNSIDANGKGHGVVYLGGVKKVVDYPGGGPLGLYLYQPNINGLVAGGAYDADGVSHAVVYDTVTKTFTKLPDVPGTFFNAAGGITKVGQTSGNYTYDPTQAGGYVAWLYGAGPYLNGYEGFIDPRSNQPFEGTITYGMNDWLVISGYYFDSNDVSHGYLKPYGKPIMTVDVPGADNTALYGVNNQGVIVGRYKKNGARHGFLMVNGDVITVDYPGAAETWITGVNDFGDICGFYNDAQGNTHGYVAKLLN